MDIIWSYVKSMTYRGFYLVIF